MTKPWARTRRLVLLPLLLLLSASTRAEDMPLPAPQQVPLLLKVLTYDRNLEAKSGKELALGIIYDPADRDSARATEEIGSTLFKFAGKTVKGLPLKYYTIEYTSPAEMERFIRQKRISVLYVAPGNSRNIAELVKVSQGLSLTTTTGVPDYVRKGIAVGIGLVQDRPQILINLSSAKAEGSDFDASLLRLATILGPR